MDYVSKHKKGKWGKNWLEKKFSHFNSKHVEPTHHVIGLLICHKISWVTFYGKTKTLNYYCMGRNGLHFKKLNRRLGKTGLRKNKCSHVSHKFWTNTP